MSTSAADVSNKLGEYMLKGWVLTDQSCSNEDCSVPLMRSPKGHTPTTYFCAKCDGGPRPREDERPTSSRTRDLSPSDANSSRSRFSITSTPPTEPLSLSSSPGFTLPEETEQARRRREQSDAATAEIGKRLLGGWAMLADVCPNTQCYGIPLVRPPTAGGGKDPRKECVACDSVYTSERDSYGREQLVASRPFPGGTSSSRRELDDQDSPSHLRLPAKIVGWTNDGNLPSKGSLVRGTVNHDHVDLSSPQIPPMLQVTTSAVLVETSESLELALHFLSQRLSEMSRNPVVHDPVSIGHTAEAIGKILQALGHLRSLHG